ncbi:MAG TPA: PDZ domain-containing protein [Terriglobia bacterium]|nr:PDZ domain-containing protein [Terriglobia bacterium]
MGATLAHLDLQPQISIRGMKIDLTGVRVDLSLPESQRTAFPGVASEGFLPATVLRHYDVVFDYPAHRFTISKPGKIVHQGKPLPVLVSPSTGFVRLTATVAGRPYGFMLDTGAAYTGVSRTLMDEWAAQHPQWPHSIGAVGAANMAGGQFDVENALMRIPKMSLGSFLLRNVGMVSRPPGVYERLVSGEMGSPVIGAIAGNVLRHFRVEVDYPAGIAYFESSGSDDATDLNCLGLVVQVKGNNTVLVSGVAKREGRPEVPGVEAGDILLQVDDHELTGTSLAEVLEYLSGSPREVKRLTVRRGNKELTVLATVLPHPPGEKTLGEASD